MSEQNQQKSQSSVKQFLASSMGRITVTTVSAVIIYGLIMAGLASGQSAIFLITAIGCAYLGWKALDRITPSIFLILPIGGWLLYFFIKGMISAVIGVFVAPFKFGKMISDAALRAISEDQ